MPDGIYSYQKSKFGHILERLGLKNVGIFHRHLEYFTAIWYILLPFGVTIRLAHCRTTKDLATLRSTSCR
jgi:hypothetical protein